MKRVSFLLLVLLASVGFCSRSAAQTVYAQVSAKKVQVGVPFEYAIVISVNANNYSPPNMRDFEIVSGPNQSNSVQYVNGAITQQMVISWGLVARKEGRFTIGPAAVAANGQRYETSAISVEVVKNAGGAGGQDRTGSGVSGEELFVRTTVNKAKCYLGEQVTIVQKVYSRNQIIGYQKSTPPSYDGFYSQAQESPTRGQLIMENVDGVNYYTHEIFRTVATANKTGRISLTPIELTPIVRRQSTTKPKSFFEQFVFGATSYEDIPVEVRSRPQVVEVLPLPEEGRPASFSGAVGNFSAKIEVSRNVLKANEAFNLKMTISGRGNLKLLNPPPMQLPEGFETYDPRLSESPNSKTFDYLIIPRREGDYTLSGIDFSFFNLDTKRYVTIPSGDIKIQVLPPDPNSAGAQVYNLKSHVKETENDIRYIKKGDFMIRNTGEEFFNGPVHLTLIALPVLGLFGGWFARRTHIRNNSNQVLVRERRAGSVARKQLQRAEKLRNQGNKDEFYAEVLMALNNYVSHKLNIPVADLSRDRMTIALQARHVKEETLHKLTGTLETAEYARYAPGAVSGDLSAVYTDTVHLITALEQQLNKKQA
jgi:hypothetical protein